MSEEVNEVTHAAIYDRLKQTEKDIAAGNRQRRANARELKANSATLQEIKELLKVLPQMQTDIEAAKQGSADTKLVVETYMTIRNVGRFAKWVAPIAAVLATVVVLLRTAGSWWIEWGTPKP